MAFADFKSCYSILSTINLPEEYFDHGLWIPEVGISKYKKSSSSSSTTSSSSSSSSSSSKHRGPPANEAVNREKINYESRFNNGASIADVQHLLFEEGFAPSYQDMEQLRASCGERVSYENYFVFRKRMKSNNDSPAKLISIFEEYDRNMSKTLTGTQIKNILMNFGESLTASECESIFRKFGISETSIVNYGDFVKKLLL